MGIRTWLLGSSATTPQPDLASLHARLVSLESDVKLIRLEWQEAFDKITRAFERWRKRVKQLQDSEEQNATNGDQDPARMNVEELTRYARNKGVL